MPMAALDNLWLCSFRRKLAKSCSAVEFAKFAIAYDPNGHNDGSSAPENSEFSPTSSDVCACRDIEIYNVAQVHEIGTRALGRFDDVTFSLYKIHVILSEAITRLKNSHEDDEGYLVKLEALYKQFTAYVQVARILASNNGISQLTRKTSAPQLHAQPHDDILDFRIPLAEYTSLLGMQDDSLPDVDCNVVVDSTSVMISWSFFKNATCANMVALTCYALSIGNFQLVAVILDSRPCLAQHLQRNRLEVASYIPIACDYALAIPIIKVIFNTAALDKMYMTTNDPLLEFAIDLIDWIVWRCFVICKYIRCSFGILYTFVCRTTRLLNLQHVNNKRQRTKLQLLGFLHSVIKQYIIYRGLKATPSLDSGNAATTLTNTNTTTSCLTLCDYIAQPASKKLAQFFESEHNKVESTPSEGSKDQQITCECPARFKDANGVYKGCLVCNTRHVAKRLEIFFQLIKPIALDEALALENPLVKVNPEFGQFLNSVVACAKSTLEDYMAAINTTLISNLEQGKCQHFEMLHVLVQVLSKSEFRERIANFVLQLLYSRNSKCNVVTELFLVKSLALEFQSLQIPVQTEDSILGHLKSLEPVEAPKVAKSADFNVHADYVNLSKLISATKTKDLTINLVIEAFKCQCKFIESVQRLFKMLDMSIDGLVVYMAPLTASLGNCIEALKLVQHILKFILAQPLSLYDFQTCIVTLHEYMAILGPVKIGDYYGMCLETLVCHNSDLNVQKHTVLITELLQMWLNTGENVARLMSFSKESLATLKRLVVAMLQGQFYSFEPLAQLCPDPWQLELDNANLKFTADVDDLVGAYLNCIGVIDAQGNFDLEYFATEGPSTKNCLLTRLHQLNSVDLVVNDRELVSNFKWLAIVERCCKANAKLVQARKSTYAETATADEEEATSKCNTARLRLAAHLRRLAASEYKDSTESLAIEAFAAILEQHGFGAYRVKTSLEKLAEHGIEILPSELRQSTLKYLSLVPNATHVLFGVDTADCLEAVDEVDLAEEISAYEALEHFQQRDYIHLGQALHSFKPCTLDKFVSIIRDEMFGNDNLQRQQQGQPKLQKAAPPDSEVTTAADLFDLTLLHNSSTDCNWQLEPLLQLNSNDAREQILSLCTQTTDANVVGLSSMVQASVDRVRESFDKLADKLGSAGAGHISANFWSCALTRAESGFSMAKSKLHKWHYKQATETKSFDIPTASITSGTIGDIGNVYIAPQPLRMQPRLAAQAILESCNYDKSILIHVKRALQKYTTSHCTELVAHLHEYSSRLNLPENVLEILAELKVFLEHIKAFGIDDVPPCVFICNLESTRAAFKRYPRLVAQKLPRVRGLYKSIGHLQDTGRLEFQLIKLPSTGNFKDLITNTSAADHYPSIKIGSNQLLSLEYAQVMAAAFEHLLTTADELQVSNVCIQLQVELLHYPHEFCKVLEAHVPPKDNSNFVAHAKSYGGAGTTSHGNTARGFTEPWRYLYWRRCVVKLLHVEPSLAPRFSQLYQASSLHMVDMLQQLLVHMGAPIHQVDNFPKFTAALVSIATPANVFQVVETVKAVDESLAQQLVTTACNACTCPLMHKVLQQHLN